MIKRNNLRYGIPFMIFIFGGLLGLREFAEIRYKYRNTRYVKDEVKDVGILTKPVEEITLEKEYEKLQKVDIDNWENTRIQRPWEETNTK
ncbi:PREDICTED: cytochrome c oxidase assembly protein COX16 homolog, mitochondrial [Dinoponera quadriceps]|uniref:Cytochrome c oxidase assembly protein COX16 homolog, mitochondrial n=1 Tax=Dinoponera quadriceps TaxID=609295 RepID=A0A6P3XED2_DINQU|nr:PREDICTED: cytochrome c oxidase assembly protein COX16 homolog, mitochondrial [Dinoponera quadriceps]